MNAVLTQDRPRTRGDCAPGAGRFSARPCPFRCRHALPDGSCTLDAADSAPLDHTQIARSLGVTRQRVWQLERQALAKLRLSVLRDEAPAFVVAKLVGASGATKPCAHCRRDFAPVHKRERYCGETCRREARAKLDHDRHAARFARMRASAEARSA